MNKKLLIFLTMLCIFFYVDDVKAETEYYDDEGNPFRLIFDETPLRNFVKNDFALTYNHTNTSNQLLAVISRQDGSYTSWAGYVYTQPLMIQIYETSTEYQNSTNIKYIVNVTPDVTVASSTNYGSRNNFIGNMVTKKNDGYYTIKGKKYKTSIAGLNYLIYGKIGDSGDGIIEYGWTQESYGGLLLTVDTEGNVQRIINVHNNSSLTTEANNNARKNLIYTSTDVYNNGGSVIIPKEEFETRNITSNYSLTCDEENPYIYDLHFNISDLKTNDNVVISYNDNSILLNETLTEQKNSFFIENAKTGNYNIKVYDDSGELIHENSFYIKVDSDVQIDVSNEDININSDDDVSTILNKNNIFLNKALVIVTPLIQIVVTFYNNLPTFLKLALISIFISLLIYLLVRRLT